MIICISLYLVNTTIFPLVCVTTLHVSALCVGHHQVCLEVYVIQFHGRGWEGSRDLGPPPTPFHAIVWHYTSRHTWWWPTQRAETCSVVTHTKVVLTKYFFFNPMPHISLTDFVVFPPGHGRSVTDFSGWDAHEVRLRCPDDVSGDIGGCSARSALKPNFY